MPGSFLSTNLLNLHQKKLARGFNTENAAVTLLLLLKMLIWSDSVNEWVTSAKSKKLLHKKNPLNFMAMDTFCLFSYPDEERNLFIVR